MSDQVRQVAIVTGSATGVGAAAAIMLAERGCNVVINYTRSKDEAEETAATCRAKGAEAITVQADVSEDADCQRMAQAAIDEWGRIDYLINNAARTKFNPYPNFDGVNKEDFLKSLGLVVDVFEVGDAHVGRVAQLINKTNQFNLTTARRTQDDVEALRDGKSHRLFAMRVTDRFGDYGLVGASIVRINDATWDLDTFLLSCRVLGRGVETAFLAGIKEAAQSAGAASMVAHFVPTPKNKPAEQFLPDHGFEQTSESDWMVPVTNLPDAPAHIARPQA